MVATNDTMDHVRVEDVLSLMPGECVNAAAFQPVLSFAVEISPFDDFIIVPHSIIAACASAGAKTDLDGLATYFHPEGSANRSHGTQTVLLHSPKSVHHLALCQIESSLRRNPELPGQISATPDVKRSRSVTDGRDFQSIRSSRYALQNSQSNSLLHLL